MPEVRSSKALRPLGLILVGVVAGMVLLILLIVRLMSPGYALPPLPVPNGHDDLMEAGRQVEVNLAPGLVLDQAPLATVAEAVALNREALALARRGLGRESRVPVRFDPSQINGSVERVRTLRGLGRLLQAEGRFAESEGRHGDAAGVYLDGVRLGQASGRGGLMIDVLVGYAIEIANGLTPLGKMRDAIPPEALPGLIRALLEVDRRAEPFDEIARREWAYAGQAHGPWMGIMFWVSSAMREQVRASIEAARAADLRVKALRRLVLLHLAVRQYREARGADPASLEALVPEILPAVPSDPYSGGSWVYRPGPEGFALYSVGPDGQDDGGRPLDFRKPEDGGDFMLESFK